MIYKQLFSPNMLRIFIKTALICSFIFAANGILLAQYKGLVVEKEKLIIVLRANKLQTRAIVEIIKSNGVGFELTPLIQAELTGAGANPEVLEAVRNNYRAADTAAKDAVVAKNVAVTKEKDKTLAKTEIKNEVLVNSIGMELVAVPAGSFMMGLSKSGLQETWRISKKEYANLEPTTYDVEMPQHRVTFTEGFLIGKTEVTQAQWTAVMGRNPSFIKNCSDCPVDTINWEEAKSFIQKLNEKNDGFEYRLPTEAEWEYAARGGTTGIFPGKLSDMAWGYDEIEIMKTHPVATKQPNAFGIYDMNGNVQEWCEDIFSPTYEGLPTDGSANTSIGDKSQRVLRGGGYSSRSTNMRSTSRNKTAVNVTNWGTGFRVAARRK